MEYLTYIDWFKTLRLPLWSTMVTSMVCKLNKDRNHTNVAERIQSKSQFGGGTNIEQQARIAQW